jgi:recombination protein RecR
MIPGSKLKWEKNLRALLALNILYPVLLSMENMGNLALMYYPEPLLKLMGLLRRLPGVGSRTAERYAFELLTWSGGHLDQLGGSISSLLAQVKSCDQCGALLGEEACSFCDLRRRTMRVICIVASPKDLYALEETGEYCGFYHVLDGLLSPLQERGPEVLHLDKLKQRVADLQIEEAILALDSTLEGDATSLYLKEQLETMAITVSRLAFGLPMGSPLEYVDGGTLRRALVGRRDF